jgi:hypothetical protein
LLKANLSFEWATEQELAFQKLKDKLVSKPILQYPDFTTVHTDASNEGLGAISSRGEIGKDLPIAYASRDLKRKLNRTAPIVRKNNQLLFGE